MTRDRCPHCTLESVCQPCADGNPPYTQPPPPTATTNRLIGRVAVQLQNIPNLYALVGTLRRPGSAPPDPDARRGTSNPSRPTVDLNVVALTDERIKKVGSDPPGIRDLELEEMAGGYRLGILGTLWIWVVLIDCELADSNQPVTSLPAENVTGTCDWLAGRLGWILDMHPDFAKDISRMHRALSQACRIRKPKEAACPKCTFRVEGQDGNSWFRCTGCEKTWVADAEVQRLFALQPPMTLRQISVSLGIPLRTLYNWEGEGRFLPVDPDPRFRVAMLKNGKAKVFDIEHVRRAVIRPAAGL